MTGEAAQAESGAAGGRPAGAHLPRTSRTPEELRRRLQAWLAGRMPPGAAPDVTEVSAASANGMSSETVLFRASWTEEGRRREERLVARLAPAASDVPVFPSYDLDAQFRTMRAVAEATAVPVPPLYWSETDATHLGSPFFVMGHVEGDVPPDVMPYNLGDSWLYAAAPEDQRRLQDATVAVLAELHSIDDVAGRFPFLGGRGAGPTPLRRHVARTRDWYEYVTAGGPPSTILEGLFRWLEDHWPAAEPDAVLSWGDSRIGNVIYRDYRPVAVLDWEMAAVGPAELDVMWLVYAHRVFEDIAAGHGLPGMPGFLRQEDVMAAYEVAGGRPLRDLAFYGTYAAVQWGIVFLRTGQRTAHFCQGTLPDDIDDLLMNRGPLEEMLAGRYWT